MSNQDQDPKNQEIVENRELSIWEALIPIIALVGMLAYNVFVLVMMRSAVLISSSCC